MLHNRKAMKRMTDMFRDPFWKKSMTDVLWSLSADVNRQLQISPIISAQAIKGSQYVGCAFSCCKAHPCLKFFGLWEETISISSISKLTTETLTAGTRVLRMVTLLFLVCYWLLCFCVCFGCQRNQYSQWSPRQILRKGGALIPVLKWVQSSVWLEAYRQWIVWMKIM